MDQCDAGGAIHLPRATFNEEGEGFRFRDLYFWNATIINHLTVVPPSLLLECGISKYA